jgi:hypothetical protein
VIKTVRLKRVFSVHSTAELRRELKDPKTNKWMKMAIYGELVKRRTGVRR